VHTCRQHAGFPSFQPHSCPHIIPCPSPAAPHHPVTALLPPSPAPLTPPNPPSQPPPRCARSRQSWSSPAPTQPPSAAPPRPPPPRRPRGACGRGRCGRCWFGASCSSPTGGCCSLTAGSCRSWRCCCGGSRPGATGCSSSRRSGGGAGQAVAWGGAFGHTARRALAGIAQEGRGSLLPRALRQQQQPQPQPQPQYCCCWARAACMCSRVAGLR
jgi:hypothetical protein